MMDDRLIQVAQELSKRTGYRPREAFMRRAVSTAYYAMFHALAQLCADELIGGKHARTVAWNRVYRALDHKLAKAMLQSKEATNLSPAIAAFGRAFAVLQERRHQADYDPMPFRYYFNETAALIELAHSAIRDLDGLGSDERRTLAVFILFKQR